MAHVSLGCVSHGDVGYVHSFGVQEIWHGQFSQGMYYGLSCGGVIAPSYPLARTWKPGMKVLVRWKPDGMPWVEKFATIPYYDSIGTLTAHFFPNEQVRLVVSNYYPESRYYPIPLHSTTPPPEPTP
ncbi:DUF3304 domain-containing protein [Xylophilus sp. GOD-11R]|uniref:DUF3304 domain-containing protein n=1 Tax=Xylophilus sp. GOD-11R TaxID=3089814 RepID=UPI00298D3C2D|nr:DUF3304 domain-containing protein [Xylophilus sp. GOD-11R]WPB55346.1 DUF3304 domain-containing protein [Xylophilus sp. GOD-11R]